MPIDQALPDEAPYGIADWTDFEDNWRDKDAEWLQGLGVPRFSTTAQRDAKLTAPATGRLCFNAEAGYLQLRGASAWADYKPLPLFMTKGEDSATQVLLSHVNAAGKGVAFSGTGPGYEVHVNTNLRAQNGVLVVDTTGVSVKTGAATAKLTTDAAALVSDVQIKAPSMAVTGAVSTGALTATSISAPTAAIPNIMVTGTVTGGVGSFSGAVTAASATIGGVSVASNTVTASSGFVSQGGTFTGGADHALMRRTGGGPNVAVYSDYIRMRTNSGIPYDNNAGAFQNAWIAIVYTADPGATNAPYGSILLT